jgi:hypothetical protein
MASPKRWRISLRRARLLKRSQLGTLYGDVCSRGIPKFRHMVSSPPHLSLDVHGSTIEYSFTDYPFIDFEPPIELDEAEERILAHDSTNELMRSLKRTGCNISPESCNSYNTSINWVKDGFNNSRRRHGVSTAQQVAPSIQSLPNFTEHDEPQRGFPGSSRDPTNINLTDWAIPANVEHGGVNPLVHSLTNGRWAAATMGPPSPRFRSANIGSSMIFPTRTSSLANGGSSTNNEKNQPTYFRDSGISLDQHQLGGIYPDAPDDYMIPETNFTNDLADPSNSSTEMDIPTLSYADGNTSTRLDQF